MDAHARDREEVLRKIFHKTFGNEALSPEDRAIVARDQLPIELPTHFDDSARYMPPAGAFHRAMNPPDIVVDTLMEAIPASVPTDARIPFVYLRANRLPIFVLNYFMDVQGPVRISLRMRLFRALHLIEAAREEAINPAMPGLVPVFPAAVQDDQDEADSEDDLD